MPVTDYWNKQFSYIHNLMMDTLEGVGKFRRGTKILYILVGKTFSIRETSLPSLSIYIYENTTHKSIIKSIYDSHNSLHIIVLKFSKLFAYKLPFGLH